jgi:hypothetical protein
MSAFDDAKSLVAHAQGELPKIKRAYDESLTSKTISPALLVEIKNFLENLRSALDFVAHGLFDRHCAKSGNKPKIYFPYATAKQSRQEFEKSGRIESCIPGISAARPDIVSLILGVQHFARGDFAWLPTFMELNNENKHQRLVPQVRKETKELRISGGGAAISLGQGASISLGQGASISVGGATIRGGQTFDANNPPRVQGGRVDVITWVSFHFETNDAPVLPLLEKALTGVGKIVSELNAKT